MEVKRKIPPWPQLYYKVTMCETNIKAQTEANIKSLAEANIKAQAEANATTPN